MLTLNSSNPTSLKTTSELDISINIAMKLITFVLVSVALCSQQVVHGSPVNDLALAIHKMAMSNNEIKSQAQELFVKAIAEELSNELKQVLKQTKSSLRNEEMALIAQNAPVVDIRDCGTVGNTLNAILQPALFWIPQGELSILVDCGLTSNCTQVRVEVPTGTIQANVEVCFDQASMDFCLRVQAAPSCTPSFLALQPISIVIPVGQTGAMGTAAGSLRIDVLGTPCVNIELDLPMCP